jgi:hypothetical protein
MCTAHAHATEAASAKRGARVVISNGAEAKVAIRVTMLVQVGPI